MTPTQEKKARAVVFLFRHGARAPSKGAFEKFETLPRVRQQWQRKDGSIMLDELTHVGHNQALELGKYLSHLIKDKLQGPEQLFEQPDKWIKWRSSASARAQESGRLFWEGFGLTPTLRLYDEFDPKDTADSHMRPWLNQEYQSWTSKLFSSPSYVSKSKKHIAFVGDIMSRFNMSKKYPPSALLFGMTYLKEMLECEMYLQPGVLEESSASQANQEKQEVEMIHTPSPSLSPLSVSVEEDKLIKVTYTSSFPAECFYTALARTCSSDSENSEGRDSLDGLISNGSSNGNESDHDSFSCSSSSSCSTASQDFQSQRGVFSSLIDETEMDQLNELAKWSWAQRFLSQEARSLLGSKLLQEMFIEPLSLLASQPSEGRDEPVQPYLSIYSAHDYTILTFLGMLGLSEYPKECLGFCCYLMLTFYDADDEEGGAYCEMAINPIPFVQVQSKNVLSVSSPMPSASSSDSQKPRSLAETSQSNSSPSLLCSNGNVNGFDQQKDGEGSCGDSSPSFSPISPTCRIDQVVSSVQEENEYLILNPSTQTYRWTLQDLPVALRI